MNFRYGLAVAGLALAGCLPACARVSPPADASTLEGTAWVLAELPGRTLVLPRNVTLRFEAGRVRGRDGCNHYTVPYKASGSTIQVGPGGVSTEMACPPEVMEQATVFMAGLTGARSYRIDGDQLRLLAPDGKLLVRLAAQAQGVAGTSWRVTGYNNGKQAVVSVLGGTTLSMAFSADGKVSGSGGCNDYSGTYQSSDAALSFGPTATTRKMCAQPERIMEQEQLFLKALGTVATARQDGDRLELRTATGALAVSLIREQ
jgi:heat shock protein HslJ